MKVKQCQFNASLSCCNRGEACLTTAKERKVYNEVISQMQQKLEAMKLPEEDYEYITHICDELESETDIELDFED